MKLALIGLSFTTLLVQAASFEVASIKPASPDEAGISGADGRNGVLKMWNVSLKRCISYTYKIPEGQILGGPKWIDELSYDILAKADHPAGEPELFTCFSRCWQTAFGCSFTTKRGQCPAIRSRWRNEGSGQLRPIPPSIPSAMAVVAS